VRVLRDDQEFGGETVLAAPPNCSLGGISGRALAYLCWTVVPDRQVLRLQDAETGAITEPPGALTVGDITQRDRANGEAFGIDGVGAALVQLRADGVHVYGPHDLVPIAGGPVVVPEADARSVPSLDIPTGRRTLCAPLRVRAHIDYDPELDESFRTFDESAYQPPWLVTIRQGRALLYRCGSRRAEDLGPAMSPLVVTRRYAAWRDADGVVVTYNFTTRRKWRYRLGFSRDRQASLFLEGTDRRLWIAGSVNRFAIEP
jgi:hypothetical protein